MDGLGNIRIGDAEGSRYLMSQRFRAPTGGTIVQIRTYLVASASPGYSAGNGGVLRLRVLPDDGTDAHRPDLSAAPLAEGVHVPGLVGGRYAPGRGPFERIAIDGLRPLVAGRLYHVVYDNVDADPAANHLSVNSIVSLVENGRPMRWLSPTDWGVLYAFRRTDGDAPLAWRERTATTDGPFFYAPVLEVGLADGRVFGNADMETGNVRDRLFVARRDAPVREVFTSRAPRTFGGFSVMTAAIAPGALQWRIVVGDTVAAGGAIERSTPDFRLVTAATTQHAVMRWHDVELPEPIRVPAGVPFTLLFSVADDGEWAFATDRNGVEYGFRWPAAFDESRAQHLRGGRWLDADHWDHSASGMRSNWRLVLHGR